MPNVNTALYCTPSMGNNQMEMHAFWCISLLVDIFPQSIPQVSDLKNICLEYVFVKEVLFCQNVHGIMCAAELLISRTTNKLFYAWHLQNLFQGYFSPLNIHTKSITNHIATNFTEHLQIILKTPWFK